MLQKKCFRDVIGFNDRWMLIIGIPSASIIVSLLLFTDLYTNGDPDIPYCMAISLVYTSAFWFGMRKTYHLLKLWYPAFEDIGKRIGWAFGIFLMVYFTINNVLGAFFMYAFPQYMHDPSPIVVFVVSMVLCALVISIYEAASFYLQLSTAVREKAELERHYVASQLEGLRNQVNPHFLFNSLNTLIYLIPEDADKAVNFVQKMSKVYRYVLESRDSKLILLEEELEFLHAFIYLLKERFGDNLQVELRNLDLRPGTAIVPLTLQMLFENAIKHNVISTEKPLTIEVFFEHDHLVVRNNLQRKNQVMDSTGVGLQNIKDRYKILTDQEVDVIASQQYFTVVVPVVELSGAAIQAA
jgi:LytS/YehU family sensor histidine kinase